MFSVFREVSYDRACTIIVVSAVICSVLTFCVNLKNDYSNVDDVLNAERSSLNSAFVSTEFEYSVVGSICAAIPVFVDLLWDIFLLLVPENKRERRFWLYRLAIFISIIVPDITVLSSLLMYQQQEVWDPRWFVDGQYFVFILSAQRVVAISVVTLILIEYVTPEQDPWDTSCFIFLQLSYNISQLLWLSTVDLIPSRTNGYTSYGGSVLIASNVLTSIVLLGFIILFGKRMYSSVRVVRASFFVGSGGSGNGGGVVGDAVTIPLGGSLDFLRKPNGIWTWLRKLCHAKRSSELDKLFPMFALFLTIVLISLSFLFELTNSYNWGWANIKLTGHWLSYVVFMFTIYAVLIIVTCARNSRRETVTHKDHLIDAKKSFVRYISHEIRTPLQTVFLGLQLLGDDLGHCLDFKDVERYRTVTDVTSSCEAALDILNDLLSFEKMDSGAMSIDAKLEPVLPFLKTSVHLFDSQASQAGIEIILDTDLPHVPRVNSTDRPRSALGNILHTLSESAHLSSRVTYAPSVVTVVAVRGSVSAGSVSGIAGDDCVVIDKTKMAQVVRNLISNALKFTPQGGTITVKARVANLPFDKNYVPPHVFGGSGGSSGAHPLNGVPMRARLASLVSGVPRWSQLVGLRHHRVCALDGENSHSSFAIPSAERHATAAAAIDNHHHADVCGCTADGGRVATLLLPIRGSLTGGNIAASAAGESPTAPERPASASASRLRQLSTNLAAFSPPQRSSPHSSPSHEHHHHHPPHQSLKSEIGSFNDPFTFVPNQKRRPSKTSTMSVLSASATRTLVLEVIDTGVGIDPGNLPKLFGEFVQFNAAELQQGGGSGLGLMLTQGLVEEHGGRISVRSEGRGKGCTFRIELPVYHQKSAHKVVGRYIEEHPTKSQKRRLSISKFLDDSGVFTMEKNLDLHPHQDEHSGNSGINEDHDHSQHDHTTGGGGGGGVGTNVSPPQQLQQQPPSYAPPAAAAVAVADSNRLRSSRPTSITSRSFPHQYTDVAPTLTSTDHDHVLHALAADDSSHNSIISHDNYSNISSTPPDSDRDAVLRQLRQPQKQQQPGNACGGRRVSGDPGTMEIFPTRGATVTVTTRHRVFAAMGRASDEEEEDDDKDEEDDIDEVVLDSIAESSRSYGRVSACDHGSQKKTTAFSGAAGGEKQRQQQQRGDGIVTHGSGSPANRAATSTASSPPPSPLLSFYPSIVSAASLSLSDADQAATSQSFTPAGGRMRARIQYTDTTTGAATASPQLVIVGKQHPPSPRRAGSVQTIDGDDDNEDNWQPPNTVSSVAAATRNGSRRPPLDDDEVPESSKHRRFQPSSLRNDPSSLKNESSSLSILLVDDSAMNRKMLCKLLMNRGHQVDEARDGKEAVEKVTTSLRSRADSSSRGGLVSGLLTGLKQQSQGSNLGSIAGGFFGGAQGGSMKGPGGTNSAAAAALAATAAAATAGTTAGTTTGTDDGTGNATPHIRTYDVILMDFVMPVMDGPTATQAIRKLGFTAPIIGLTGNAMEADITHFMSKGANKVLTKPLRIDDFDKVVRREKD